ncbi:hypothetical protein L293_0405 [Acinetobacter gyllenbergii CIP 110306 = MTCC 11365]|nr:hypothetical protein L293_0405 [Acinetobacter gyllenbergii CIP 110306 = MTCC 11365]
MHTQSETSCITAGAWCLYSFDHTLSDFGRTGHYFTGCA